MAFSSCSAYDPPSPAELLSLPYLKATTQEALRLFPFFASFTCTAANDTFIDDMAVPKGSRFNLPLWVISRDTEMWGPDAAEFRPERWLAPDFEASLPRFAYFPFGGGPRKCIGEGFAWMEGVLALATLARRWRLRHVRGARVHGKPGITLRAVGLRMRVESA